jgi:hypothetical protein
VIICFCRHCFRRHYLRTLHPASFFYLLFESLENSLVRTSVLHYFEFYYFISSDKSHATFIDKCGPASHILLFKLDLSGCRLAAMLLNILDSSTAGSCSAYQNPICDILSHGELHARKRYFKLRQKWKYTKWLSPWRAKRMSDHHPLHSAGAAFCSAACSTLNLLFNPR